jgi:hypothetical protein
MYHAHCLAFLDSLARMSIFRRLVFRTPEWSVAAAVRVSWMATFIPPPLSFRLLPVTLIRR